MPRSKNSLTIHVNPAMRRYILNRDARTCQYCGRADAPLIAEHVIPQAWGGLAIPHNIVAACLSCNALKGRRVWIPRNLDAITEGHAEWRAKIVEAAVPIGPRKSMVPKKRVRTAGQVRIVIESSLWAAIKAREGKDESDSLIVTRSLNAFYFLLSRAERTVRSVLSPEQLDTCRAVLSGTFIEPAIVPHLVAEIQEGLDEPDERLITKLRGFGLMELYALARIAKEPM